MKATTIKRRSKATEVQAAPSYAYSLDAGRLAAARRAESFKPLVVQAAEVQPLKNLSVNNVVYCLQVCNQWRQ